MNNYLYLLFIYNILFLILWNIFFYVIFKNRYTWSYSTALLTSPKEELSIFIIERGSRYNLCIEYEGLRLAKFQIL